VEIHVLQGERAMARDNKSLGKFLLTGIPPAPRGVPQIEVSFEIDVNGILQVSATDKGTGKEQRIRITNTGGLSATEVERMRQEADKYAEEDRRRIQLVELKNQFDSLVYSFESTLKDNSDVISGSSQGQTLEARANEKMQQIQESMKDSSITIEEVKQQIYEFQQTLFEIGGFIYANASKSSAPEEFTSVEESAPSIEFNKSAESTQDEGDLILNFDDETVTADYEAVD
jgi:molecular chaperone DnaK